jgi:hypothetical protein
MDAKAMLEEVEKGISRLQQVANLLRGDSAVSSKRRGRKPMSQEARAKIAAAQKKRWAKAKA